MYRGNNGLQEFSQRAEGAGPIMAGQVVGLTDFMLDHACSLLGLTFESFLDWNINWGP